MTYFYISSLLYFSHIWTRLTSTLGIWNLNKSLFSVVLYKPIHTYNARLLLKHIYYSPLLNKENSTAITYLFCMGGQGIELI